MSVDEDRIAERLAKVETVITFHEERMNRLEKNLNDLTHKMEEMLLNQNTILHSIESIQNQVAMRGLKWFLEKMALPMVVAILTAIMLKFF